MTYSIVARDLVTGEVGVAVQSHFFAVGALCPYVEEGVGAVATQAFVEPAYGPGLLDLLRDGVDPQSALNELLAADPGSGVRQVAVVDSHGHVAVHTGEQCIEACGHRTGDGVSVQGNMLVRDEVWSSMLAAYEAAVGEPLAERLLAALDAAEANGGDVRGRQSAALKTAGAGTSIDLRVDDHPVPLDELRRLLAMQRATNHLLAAEGLVLDGDAAGAGPLFAKAQETFGDNLEPTFWAGAMALATGDVEAAVPSLRAAIASHAGWRDLLERLPRSGGLPIPVEHVAAALARLDA